MLNQHERARGRSLWALAAVLLAMAGMVLMTGRDAQSASAALAPTPTYDLPTPTATPTRTPSSQVQIVTGTPTSTGTPFQDKLQPAPTGPRLMKPFPSVRTAGNYNRRRTQLTRVRVTGPAGARIAGRCTKLARKCRTDISIHKGNKVVPVKRLQRKFKPRTVVWIRVTAPGVYGKYVVVKMRKGKPPVRHDLCLKPGKTKPVACPSS